MKWKEEILLQLHLWLVYRRGVSERECKLYAEGLRSEVKLSLYRTFSKKVGFKKYIFAWDE